MIDLHCHILPGVDDGARDLGESLEMARLAVESGVRAVVATPHCVDGGALEVWSGVKMLRNALEEAGIPLYLFMGMEIFGTPDTVQLLSPLTNRVRQMYYYKTLKAKGYADREIVPVTGIRSNVLWLYEKQTRAFSEQQLKEYLELCIRMDFEFKSGKISDDNALDTIIMAMINKKAKLPKE